MWSFIFRDVIIGLRSKFRCITLDFPGYGLSPDAVEPLTLRQISDALGAFVDALELDDFRLVVHDLDGPAALAMAETRADRVNGLVLSKTFLWTPDTRGLRLMFRVVGSRPMAAFGTVTNLVPRLTAGKGGVGRHLGKSERRVFREPYGRWAHRWRFHGTLRSAYRDPELTGQAEAVASGPLHLAPVLTIFGERNDPFGFQRRHEAMFPNHEGVVVERGNHFPMMDAPNLFSESVAARHEREVQGAATGRQELPEEASTA